eukprot:9126782-Ditylum_brightwellii.AAC.1
MADTATRAFVIYVMPPGKSCCSAVLALTTKILPNPAWGAGTRGGGGDEGPVGAQCEAVGAGDSRPDTDDRSLP